MTKEKREKIKAAVERAWARQKRFEYWESIYMAVKLFRAFEKAIELEYI